MWDIDQETLLHSLEVVYNNLFSAECVQFSPLTLHSEVSLTPTIVEFQQFTEGEKPSVFTFLLQHHSRHIACVLKWALDKMIQLFNHSPARYKYKEVHELKWLVAFNINSYK